MIGLIVAACVLLAGVFLLGTTGLRPAGSPSATPPPTAPPSGNGTTPTPIPPMPAPPTNRSATRLALDLATDRSSYQTGDAAVVTITLANLGNSTVFLGLPNPCSMVFMVYGQAGQIVFNSSRYFGCIQVWQDLVLAPGASQTSVYRWPLVTDNGFRVTAPAVYKLVPSFESNLGYQASVVRTGSATIDVSP